MKVILVVLLLAMVCHAQDGGKCLAPGNLCTIFPQSQVRPKLNEAVLKVCSGSKKVFLKVLLHFCFFCVETESGL